MVYKPQYSPHFKIRPVNRNARRLCRRTRLGNAREELPVWTARQALLQHIREHDCLVVVGETGSGKTTQLPQLLLKAGLANDGCIACTQPRRVAAITVARRVAQELPCHLGQEVSLLKSPCIIVTSAQTHALESICCAIHACFSQVGYSVRFDDKSCASTKIRYMTDGMLLREALRSPSLERYQVLTLPAASASFSQPSRGACPLYATHCCFSTIIGSIAVLGAVDMLLHSAMMACIPRHAPPDVRAHCLFGSLSHHTPRAGDRFGRGS